MDSSMQLAIIVLLYVFSYQARGAAQTVPRAFALSYVIVVIVVALSLTGEGSEIILYIGGIIGQPESVSPVMLGGLMAAGIGVSCGVFLFYGLAVLPLKYSMRGALLLMALFAGDKASQAIQLLSQADLVPYTPQAWDSSRLLSENSIVGQLLYALIGYEATPSYLQVAAYLLVMLGILPSPLYRAFWHLEETLQS